MLSRFLPNTTSLSWMARRTYVTYAQKRLQAQAESLRKTNPHFKADLELLESSPRTYHVTEGAQNRFQAETHTIEVKPGDLGKSGERLIHETHHGAHHEDMTRKLGEDNVDRVIRRADFAPGAEISALATGKSGGGATNTQIFQETQAHYQAYQQKFNFPPMNDVLTHIRTSKAHSYVAQRLKDFGFPGF
jgi:hypothetical protein